MIQLQKRLWREKEMQISKEDFKYFVSRCHYWINKFELNNYRLHFEHKYLENCNAKIIAHSTERTATIALSDNICYDEFYKEITKNEYIDNLAKHECIHLLLGNFSWWAHSRYVDESVLDGAEEETVVKLEKIIT